VQFVDGIAFRRIRNCGGERCGPEDRGSGSWSKFKGCLRAMARLPSHIYSGIPVRPRILLAGGLHSRLETREQKLLHGNEQCSRPSIEVSSQYCCEGSTATKRFPCTRVSAATVKICGRTEPPASESITYTYDIESQESKAKKFGGTAIGVDYFTKSREYQSWRHPRHICSLLQRELC
jgi:hypothetical protein